MQDLNSTVLCRAATRRWGSQLLWVKRTEHPDNVSTTGYLWMLGTDCREHQCLHDQQILIHGQRRDDHADEDGCTRQKRNTEQSSDGP